MRLVASFGTSCTAIVRATEPDSVRIMWTAPPPMSMNESVPVAENTSGVHEGSSPSYSVTVPWVTITKLGPGWVCQPLVQVTAAERLSGTRRSRAAARLESEFERLAPAAPFSLNASRDFFSARIGCQVCQSPFGIDLAALCVRKRPK